MTPDTETTLRDIMSGRQTDEQIISFLTALSKRGETVDDIVAAARVMREIATAISAPDDAVDCCGTGGDGKHTLNISTAVAIVSAACGVPVAKHGNRAASSKSGAADVLQALGINLDLPKEKLELALRRFNFCFLMAPHHHSAMKHVANARKTIGTRTIFNLLGPLANPAGTKRQLIGVYDDKWREPIAHALHALGSERAWVVHGSDGMDEITLTGETNVSILYNGHITNAVITPEQLGLPRCKPEDLKGWDAQTNADALTALLNGHPSAYRDIVLANTAAVLNIHGTSTDLKQGILRAVNAIDTGKARDTLNAYITFSQGKSE